MRRIELDLSAPADPAVFQALPGARDVTVEDNRAFLAYDGRMEDLLRAVMERYELLDIRTQEADLEEIFLTYYRNEGDEA